MRISTQVLSELRYIPSQPLGFGNGVTVPTLTPKRSSLVPLRFSFSSTTQSALRRGSSTLACNGTPTVCFNSFHRCVNQRVLVKKIVLLFAHGTKPIKAKETHPKQSVGQCCLTPGISNPCDGLARASWTRNLNVKTNKHTSKNIKPTLW